MVESISLYFDRVVFYEFVEFVMILLRDFMKLVDVGSMIEVFEVLRLEVY